MAKKSRQDNGHSESLLNKAERGFGLPAQDSKSAVTRPSTNVAPLPLNFSKQTDSHHTMPQFMKVQRQKSDL